MIRLRILTGAKAGIELTFTGERITVGRQPGADLQFSPAHDLAVSTHHAVIWTDGRGWFVRDLTSRNGTFVNGQRISDDTPLTAGDRIAFGSEEAAIAFLAALSAAAPATAASTAPTTANSPTATARIRSMVARETRWLRRTLALLACALIAATGLFLYGRQHQRASWDRERTALEQRIDSIRGAGEESIRSLEEELEGLTEALDETRGEARRLAAALASARTRGDADQVARLQRQLQAANLAVEQQQLAATLDFRAIERANRRAVARIYIESAEGEVSTGTAFAVRPDATLLTNRHVLLGPDGTQQPRRIAVQFSDSDQVWPARLLAISDDADLALVRVDNILGTVPTISAFNARADTIARGSPIATIGFPLGGNDDLPDTQPAPLARPLIFAGILSRTLAERYEFLGYGASGASGSPIFDANGEVIAILYAGRQDPAGHLSLGVPAAAALDLLRKIR